MDVKPLFKEKINKKLKKIFDHENNDLKSKTRKTYLNEIILL